MVWRYACGFFRILKLFFITGFLLQYLGKWYRTNGPLVSLPIFNSSNKNKAGDINSVWNLLVCFFFVFFFFPEDRIWQYLFSRKNERYDGSFMNCYNNNSLFCRTNFTNNYVATYGYTVDSLSRSGLSRITAYLKAKILSLPKHENLTIGEKYCGKEEKLLLFSTIFSIYL